MPSVEWGFKSETLFVQDFGKPGVAMQAYKPSTLEAEAGRPWVLGLPKSQSSRPDSMTLGDHVSKQGNFYWNEQCPQCTEGSHNRLCIAAKSS